MKDSHVETFALSVIAVILLSISEGRQNGLEDHANARLHGTREAMQTTARVNLRDGVLCYCPMLNADLQRSPSGWFLLVGGIPRNCVQAAARVSQLDKAVQKRNGFFSRLHVGQLADRLG
jgi:hypothetical protein